MKKTALLLFLALALLLLPACGNAPAPAEVPPVQAETPASPAGPVSPEEPARQDGPALPEDPAQPEAPVLPEEPVQPEDPVPPVDGNGWYYDLEGVVLYLYTYEELPTNYITKAKARELGWEGGSVEVYREGAAIGGDTFGNREGLLPAQSGRSYTECDLNTQGKSSRGAERLIFSNDGLYFYTQDHYASFTQVYVVEGEVVWQ